MHNNVLFFTTVTAVNPVIEIGFVQDSYTVTEGDTAILMYSIFSDFSLVNNEFASLIAQFVPLTASGMFVCVC